ncbi:helix-turn-helix transcriptional regulator [Acuticoccus kandeliae]|uniref:helix-turn-helix transcriptional regulator n=1 Tax=Acuticoccus kandeliae TaxID=2073160 RepID=UPI000D3E61DF|nr:hypothetical protein [Acuticoccus kandeliae]
MDLDAEAQAIAAEAFRAVLDPSAWSAVADRLARMCEGPAIVSMRVFGADGSHERIVGLTGVDETALGAYLSHYSAINPYNALVTSAPDNRITYDDALIDRGIVRRSAFYNEWRHPIVPGGGGLLLNVARNAQSVLALAFDLDDRGMEIAPKRIEPLLARLSASLWQATELAQRVVTESASGAIGAVIGTMSVGAIAIDRLGHVVNANDAAEALFGRGFLYLDRTRRVHGKTPFAESMLQYLLSEALGARPRTATIRLRDYGADGDIFLTAVPMVPEKPFARAWALLPDDDAPSAIVYLATERQREIDVTRRLVVLFDLSSVEAGLAYAIYRGMKREDAAARLGLSHFEAAVALETAMRKMDVTRYRDLARRVGHLSRMAG